MRGLSVLWLGLGFGCGGSSGDGTCPDGYVMGEEGMCLIESTPCPDGYVRDDTGNCLFEGTESSTQSTTSTSTSTPTGTSSTSTTPTTSTTTTTTEEERVPGQVDWFGVSSFRFRIVPVSGYAASTVAIDGSTSEVQIVFMLADHDFMTTFDPDKGFMCMVAFETDRSLPPVLEGWPVDGGASIGYEFPADARVVADNCAPTIAAHQSHYLLALREVTVGMGLHVLSEEEVGVFEDQFATWPDLEPFAVGAGWHFGDAEAGTDFSDYSRYGYAVGYRVDKFGALIPSSDGEMMPVLGVDAVPETGFPASLHFEGVSYQYWPASDLLGK